MAYAVGLRVLPDQLHAELAALCAPAFRQRFRRTVLRLGAATAPGPAGLARTPGAWHRLRV